MRNKLLKIIEHYGVSKQLKYFQSEVFELNEAIIEREIHWGDDTSVQDIRTLDRHIAEEIADCYVMLEQFRQYYNISNEDLMNLMKFKIERQLRRIEDEETIN